MIRVVDDNGINKESIHELLELSEGYCLYVCSVEVDIVPYIHLERLYDDGTETVEKGVLTIKCDRRW